MAKPDSLLFSLQKMIVDLSLIDRNHYLAGTNRRENDIEHSVSVMLLCWYIHSKHKLDLDIGKVMKYAIAHDFVERYAGDVNTFASTEERATKVKNEAESLERLAEEFRDFPDLVATIRGYEAKQDEESLFVWTVDKMQALIMGDMDSWRPYSELGISYDRFVSKHSEQLEASSPYCRQIYEEVIEYCRSTYYDQPTP